MISKIERFEAISDIIQNSSVLTSCEATWDSSFNGWNLRLTEHRIGFIVFKITYSDDGSNVRLFFQDQLLDFHNSFNIRINDDGSLNDEASRCIMRQLAGIQGNVTLDIEQGFIPAD